MTQCKDRPGKKYRCEEPETIRQWIAKHPFFFVIQQTNVKYDMFSDSNKVNEFPYNGDTKNYFPTIRNYKSIDYGKIYADAQLFREEYQFTEINLGMEELEINDEPLYLVEETRKTNFVNVENIRKLTDFKVNYE